MPAPAPAPVAFARGRITTDSISPHLDSISPDLAQMGADAINRRLSLRPDAEELHEKGILKVAVGGAKSRLERRITSDTLNHGLARRTSAVALQARADGRLFADSRLTPPLP